MQVEKELNNLSYRNYHGDLSSGDLAKEAFKLGAKSQQAEIERLIKIIEGMPAEYIPEEYWKRKGE